MFRLNIFLFAGLVISQSPYAGDRVPTRELLLQNGNIRVVYTALQGKMEPPKWSWSSDIFVMVFDDETRTERLFTHFRKLDYKPSYNTRRSGFNVGMVFGGKAEEKPHSSEDNLSSEMPGSINVGATALNVAGLVALAGISKVIGFDPITRIDLLAKDPIVQRPGIFINEVEFRDNGRKASGLVIFNVCESSNRDCSQVLVASYSPDISLDEIKDIAIDEGVTRALGLRD